MKKILILGGTQFFGKKLVERLVKAGHQVTVLTRGQKDTHLEKSVEHIIANRLDTQQLSAKLQDRFFDIVYDNICFSSNEAYALCEVLKGKTNKLVFTSTLAVYECDGEAKSEMDFNPFEYEIQMGDKEQFTYAEGKRQAEAVFYKYAPFPVVAVRFPIVLGVDDYTRRLHYHVERVANEQPIKFENINASMSFIDAKEAAEFLDWAGFSSIEGPFNATASGSIAFSELIHLIEKATGKTAQIELVENQDETCSPFSIPQSWYMTNEKATHAGFNFSTLNEWFIPLIEHIAREN